MGNDRAWVVFDADNTLWHVEPLYDAAAARLGILADGLGLDEATVIGRMREVDAALHRTMGYSAARFPLSFETALRDAGVADLRAIAEARALAEAVFTAEPCLAEGLGAVLDACAGEYRLAILTAGDEAVQHARLAGFPLAGRFARAVVVPRKEAAAWAACAVAIGADPGRSWAVGDSLRSDVLPALDAGFRAVHVRHANWSVEHADARGRGFASVARLADVPAALGLPVPSVPGP